MKWLCITNFMLRDNYIFKDSAYIGGGYSIDEELGGLFVMIQLP